MYLVAGNGDGDADDDTVDVAAVDVLMALPMLLLLLPLFVVSAGSQGICRGDYNTFQLRIPLLLLLVSTHQPAARIPNGGCVLKEMWEVPVYCENVAIKIVVISVDIYTYFGHCNLIPCAVTQ